MPLDKILLVGCGKMGFALLCGMTSSLSMPPENILVIEPSATEINVYGNQVKSLQTFEQKIIAKFNPTIIIFAVKPQIIEDVLPQYKQFVRSSLFISIIAGKTTSFFQTHLGENTAIIRTMPNLPVTVSKGVTAFFQNQNVTERLSQFPRCIFESCGMVFYVDKKSGYDESILDGVTAISGSGPAYLFYFIECQPELTLEPLDSNKFVYFTKCLENAAIKLGFNDSDAELLAAQTVRGSLFLLQQSGKSAFELRKAVTSPGGTTEAALKILMQGGKEKMQGVGMKELMVEATRAAWNRSKVLSD